MMAWNPDERAAFIDGAKGASSLIFGIVPWGLVTGVSMVTAGFTPTQAIAMGIFVFAGSMQLSVLPLLAAKAPLWVMYATGLVVNLRYFIYSAVLARYFGRLSRPWRVGLSYITVDGMFALFVGRYRVDDPAPHKHWYYFGGSALMWTAWQGASIAGIFGGSLIPRDWSLEFAATLALMALLIPLLYDRSVVLGAMAAGVTAVLAIRLPLNLGIVVAVTAGVLAGLVTSRLLPRAAQESATDAP
jgi:predicted branched-subunit amino acid permease